jgi:5'-nucleotidase
MNDIAPVQTEQFTSILLTNDDGIKSPGLRVLYEGLSEIADVTVVAPTVEHSGIGRVLSFGRPVPLQTGHDTHEIEWESTELAHEVPYHDHELGYAVEGTPCDCVIAGITALDFDPDIVVSGCNPGPNIGVSAFGRSGTISAIVEGASLGIPGIAVSSKSLDPEPEAYDRARQFTVRFVEQARSHDIFGQTDYFNVTVPSAEHNAVKLTHPTEEDGFTAKNDASRNTFQFTHSEHRTRILSQTSVSELMTDREALQNDIVSVTPLSLPYTPVVSSAAHDLIDSL